MSKPVIVCVDDEKIVLDSLKSELKNAFNEDYTIEISESGEDTLELFKDLLKDGNDIPVVISDYAMPGMKGDELLKHIHALSPDTLKIMLTGQATIKAVSNAVNQAKLYRFIPKPWTSADLTLTIQEALKSYAQTRMLQHQHQLLEQQNKQLEDQNNRLAEYNLNLEQKVKERTHELVEKNQQMLEDLVLAGDVQKRIFPICEMPPFLKMAFKYIPYNQVSGDIYYAQQKDPKTFDFFMGDVTGHGVAAAFITILTNMALEEALAETSLENIMLHLNTQLESHTAKTRFVTGIFLRISNDGTMLSANAAHPRFMIIPANGEDLIFTKKRGTLLGVFPNERVKFPHETISLRKGDKIVLYTDGLIEQENSQKKLYGDLRLQSLLKRCCNDDIEVLLDKLMTDLDHFSEGAPRGDDLTITIIEFLGL
ncbi:MAG: fused response regulator/phosphatase [SAR324 cluster bacterium]|nr:fused response regulator/phosphatase [SAR324 cluster bacterium]MBF0351141.1 fused response regulator/phosphatase [SAR324 cluster bacterium]